MSPLSGQAVNDCDKVRTNGYRIRPSRAQVRKAVLIERAAKLLWEDELTDQQIAEQLGIHRATLARWKYRPDLQALIQVHLEAYRVRIATEPLPRRGQRRQRVGSEAPETRHLVEKTWV